MVSLAVYTEPPRVCPYRPGETVQMTHEYVRSISPSEYEERMNAGWRRFGHSLFSHSCPACSACQSLRIPVATFAPNRSQRRAWAANADVSISLYEPHMSQEVLDLYERFHADHEDRVGWPRKDRGTESFYESFVHQPFPVEQWHFHVGDRLVGVGYVDNLPTTMSAIYFVHEPAERKRSLGTFNVLAILMRARQLGKTYVHLGYFVEGCRSLEYKQRFGPHEVLTAGTRKRKSVTYPRTMSGGLT